MQRKKWAYSLLFLLLYLGGFFLLLETQERRTPQKIESSWIERINSGNKKGEFYPEDAIGVLSIPKINVVQNLYEIDDQRNTVEQNVMILKGSTYPNQEKSKLYLAAHSGSGKIAYFEELDELQKKDTFNIYYKEKVYTYQIDIIESQEKTGTITVPVTSKKQAILTTCHPQKEKKQLVLVASLIKETDI